MIETISNKRRNPCQGCPDRYPACSDHCTKPAFLEWKAEQEKIRKARAAYDRPSWYSEEPYQKRADPNKRRKRRP